MNKKIIAQKFGGTSVATPESREKMLSHVIRTVDEGFQPALVVSAMGRKGAPYATDTLISLLRAEGGPVDGRDEDLIYHTGEVISAAMVSHLLKLRGHSAEALIGWQAGVLSTPQHRRARIVSVEPERMLKIIENGGIPVVTGGQGYNKETNDVTILGRGASDLSGVAVGVALNALKTEIYSDVPGIATTDPRIVPEARFLDEIDFQRVYEIGIYGAKVIHPGAVKMGMNAGLEIVCRSTFDSLPGTSIKATENDPDFTGITSLSPVALLTAHGLKADQLKPETLFDRFSAVLLKPAEREPFSMAVPMDYLGAFETWLNELGAGTMRPAENMGLVTAVGKPEFLKAHTAASHEVLAAQGIKVHESSSFSNHISFVLDEAAVKPAIQALHNLLQAD